MKDLWEASRRSGFLDTINPFNSWGSIPDIGPVYEGSMSYTMGYVAGALGGVAIQFMIGNAAGGARGLVACGSALQKAAKIYDMVSTAAGVVEASINLYNGNAGLGDLLNFAPALGFAGSKAGIKIGALKENCFTGDTEVLTGYNEATGEYTSTPIDQIVVGDVVLTMDPANPDAGLVTSEVTQVFVTTKHDLQTVTVQAIDASGGTSGGFEEVIHVTDEHPFYVDGVGWTTAADLREGYRLLNPDGLLLTVVSNVDEWHEEGILVYNLEVADAHTYFVADGLGDEGWMWVHNDCDIRVNKAAGDAARDAIARREAPARIEQVFNTVGGTRRVDVLKSGKQLTAIESKVGRTGLNAVTRQEPARDWWLLRQGKVHRVIWEFRVSDVTGKVGPTKTLRAMLQKLGFEEQ